MRRGPGSGADQPPLLAGRNPAPPSPRRPASSPPRSPRRACARRTQAFAQQPIAAGPHVSVEVCGRAGVRMARRPRWPDSIAVAWSRASVVPPRHGRRVGRNDRCRARARRGRRRRASPAGRRAAARRPPGRRRAVAHAHGHGRRRGLASPRRRSARRTWRPRRPRPARAPSPASAARWAAESSRTRSWIRCRCSISRSRRRGRSPSSARTSSSAAGRPAGPWASAAGGCAVPDRRRCDRRSARPCWNPSAHSQRAGFVDQKQAPNYHQSIEILYQADRYSRVHDLDGSYRNDR